jgi:hypothetical protein
MTDSQDKICWSCKAKQPKQLISNKEAKLAENVIISLRTAISAYKDALEAPLRELGERGWLEGDGILRVEDGDDSVEYRVFFQGEIATEYAGTFGNIGDARTEWGKRQGRSPEDVDVYMWSLQVDDKWVIVQYEDLEEDPEIKKWVTGEILPSPTDEAPKPVVGPEEFPGEDFPLRY